MFRNSSFPWAPPAVGIFALRSTELSARRKGGKHVSPHPTNKLGNFLAEGSSQELNCLNGATHPGDQRVLGNGCAITALSWARAMLFEKQFNECTKAHDGELEFRKLLHLAGHQVSSGNLRPADHLGRTDQDSGHELEFRDCLLLRSKCREPRKHPAQEIRPIDRRKHLRKPRPNCRLFASLSLSLASNFIAVGSHGEGKSRQAHRPCTYCSNPVRKISSLEALKRDVAPDKHHGGDESPKQKGYDCRNCRVLPANRVLNVIVHASPLSILSKKEILA